MSSLPLFQQPLLDARPLAEHQSLALAMLRRSIKSGKRRPVIQLATGAGKTRLAAEIVAGALAKGNRVAFTVPAISLIDQTVEAFEREGIRDIGVMQANHHRTNWTMPCQVISVQSLAKRNKPLAHVVIVDECHLSFKAVRDWMDECPEVIFIGLSATPWARGMSDVWDDLMVPVSMEDLIGIGWLSPFRSFAGAEPDMTGVRVVAGDYHEGDLAEATDKPKLIADVADTWLRLGEGRPTLVFAVNCAHAKHLVEQFAARGVTMGYCDAHVDLIERKLLFARLSAGEISGIVNVGTLTTGVDADIRCIVLARATRSEMLYVQMVGRGLRKADGKADCIVLDHGGNHERMGFVTDVGRKELADGRAKQTTAKERQEATPKPCGKCGTIKAPKVHICPACGFKPEKQSDIEHEDGVLIPITKQAKATSSDKQKFWSMALYVDSQKNKGGKMAKALYREKFGVWPKGLFYARMEPDLAFQSYQHSRRIAYAKRRQA